jgi:hypothetical protein
MPKPETAALPADAAKGRVPAGHPLEMWEIEEAAERCRIGVETLRSSTCPRAKFGTRVLFDPIETIAFMRLHLTHTVSEAA